MVPAIIALLVVLGGGTTVIVADGAAPGDALYGIDRATERVRLRLASDERKQELELRFAEERVEELDVVIAEESEEEESTSDGAHDSEDGAGTTGLTEVEAKVFTNETVIKVEFDDTKHVLTASTTNQAEIAQRVADEFDLSRADVEAVLMVEVKNRASVESDRKFVRIADTARVEVAAQNAIESLGEVAGKLEGQANDRAVEAINTALDRLFARIDALPEDTQTRIKYERKADGEESLKLKVKRTDDSRDGEEDGDDEGEIEIKRRVEGDGRFKFEWRSDDDEIRIESRSRDDDENDDDDRFEEENDDDHERKEVSTRRGLNEVKVRLGSETSRVRVKLHDDEFDLTFETANLTEIKAKIIQEFEVSIADVERVIVVEHMDDDVEMRTSEDGDKGDDEEERKDEDDDRDDDRHDGKSDSRDDERTDDEEDGDDRSDRDDERDDDDERGDDTAADDAEIRIEAKLEGDRAEVHVRIGDTVETYTSTATTRAALLLEIAGRYNLPTSVVDAVFELED